MYISRHDDEIIVKNAQRIKVAGKEGEQKELYFRNLTYGSKLRYIQIHISFYSTLTSIPPKPWAIVDFLTSTFILFSKEAK